MVAELEFEPDRPAPASLNDCEQALRRIAKQLGHAPSLREYGELVAWPPTSAVKRFYGSWTAARQALGLAPAVPQPGASIVTTGEWNKCRLNLNVATKRAWPHQGAVRLEWSARHRVILVLPVAGQPEPYTTVHLTAQHGGCGWTVNCGYLFKRNGLPLPLSGKLPRVIVQPSGVLAVGPVTLGEVR